MLLIGQSNQILIYLKVELSLAYGCEEELSNEMLLQYIHTNRNHNARRIQTLGNPLSSFKWSTLKARTNLLC